MRPGNFWKSGMILCLILYIGCGPGYRIPKISEPPVTVPVVVDASQPEGTLDHAWEYVAGSGHAGLYIREGWSDRHLAHLADAHDNLGIRYVRFHGIFIDEVGVYQGPGNYDFSGVDRVYDGILAAGVKPFIELSFMPEELASGRARGFPLGYAPKISPPTSYQEWGNMMEAFARHLVDRYGLDEVRTWYFEVWNEPNLFVFWGGDMDDYFRLYDATARAIKSVDTELKVGGPATSQAAWIWEFLMHCHEQGVPVDFVTTHGYYNEILSKLLAQAEKADLDVEDDLTGRTYHDQVRIINKIMEKSPFGKLPLFITEWNSSIAYSYNMPSIFVSWPNDHDLPNDAAFMCKAVKEANGYTDGFAHWTYSDVFEEWGLPGTQWPVRKGAFHGGFGLITIDGIHKPSYHAFAFLHQMGSNLVRTEVEGQGRDIDAMATLDNGELNILVWYWLDTISEKQTSGPEALMTLRIENLPDSLVGKKLLAYRIDRNHGNPFTEWIKMGKPGHLNREQINRLKQTSDTTLRETDMDQEINSTSMTLEFPLPPASVMFLTSEEF